jgi:L-asparaginase
MQNVVGGQGARHGTVVVLGTGGTIAGTAASALDNLGYTAGTLGVEALLTAVPALQGQALESEQVAQVDSKDMGFVIWQALAQRTWVHLQRPEVAGVVITHGTDTLEETAYFLHRVLATNKPVVLTAAMRPATSLQADGPQNLLDAVIVARSAQAPGVLVVMHGAVFDGGDVRKLHTHRLDAFGAGDAGPPAQIEAGRLHQRRAWHGLFEERAEGPSEGRSEGRAEGCLPLGLATIAANAAQWPRVEIVLNHAGANGRVVDALVQQGLDGLVLAGTGNGTLSTALEAAALRAQAAGVQVLRASRCALGTVQGGGSALSPAAGLSVVQARVELILRCLHARLFRLDNHNAT